MPENRQQDDRTMSFVTIAKGSVVSHYRIIKKIGSGGMGEVYLAEDTKLKREVALKFLPSQYSNDKELVSRFTREAQATAALKHPNIVTVYEVSEYRGRPFFAMEHVEGQSLRDSIKDKELSLDRIADFAIQICEGLHEAHEAGVVHRDVKPSNIILDKKGRPRLLDFGLAAIKGTDKLTKTGSTLGTVGYMSPEQARGEETDARSDLFSFGVVLYEMITGRAPFKADTEAATLNSVLNDIPEPLRRFKANIPDTLQAIIDKALDKDVAMRYQTSAGIISDLRKLKRELESQTSAAKPQPSIAVLPFTNLSADKEQEYFCDGMAEEIINALTKVKDLRVVARTSCFAFKGRSEDIREIGRKLSVQTLLEGSVRKAGNRLRITAQLINVTDGYHLWSEKFDRDMEDIFAIQDEISLAIVERLKAKLLPGGKAEIAIRRTDDPDAYNFYLKGRYFWNKRTEEGIKKAAECFEEAIQKDPDYALAYAGLADVHILLADFNPGTLMKYISKAEKAALKSLELDDSLAEAHTSLAQIRLVNWDWSGAEREYKQAIELNPNYPTTYHWYALYLTIMGRNDDAIKAIKRARELDPLSLIIGVAVGVILYLARHYDRAIEECRKVLDMDPDFVLTHRVFGWAFSAKGKYEKAIEAFKNAIRLSKERDSHWLDIGLGIAYALSGEIKKASEMLDKYTELAKHEHVPPLALALLCFAMGKNDLGFEWLEKACETGDMWLAFFRNEPLFDSVRNDPRFIALFKKMGLEK